jgi:hypothetical protein
MGMLDVLVGGHSGTHGKTGSMEKKKAATECVVSK